MRSVVRAVGRPSVSAARQSLNLPARAPTVLARREAYAETKLHDVLIAFAVARRWTDVLSNALEPGWVARAPPTIWKQGAERRSGWRSATIPPRW